jgi:hypothetical protein
MKPETITIDEVKYVRADSVPVLKKTGSQVIVRTVSAIEH